MRKKDNHASNECANVQAPDQVDRYRFSAFSASPCDSISGQAALPRTASSGRTGPTEPGGCPCKASFCFAMLQIDSCMSAMPSLLQTGHSLEPAAPGSLRQKSGNLAPQQLGPFPHWTSAAAPRRSPEPHPGWLPRPVTAAFRTPTRHAEGKDRLGPSQVTNVKTGAQLAVDSFPLRPLS